MKQVRNWEHEICQRKIDRIQFKAMLGIVVGTVLGAIAGFLMR
jgi:hypothetical protein